VGTIIRIADWYGIDDIFCSDDTADVYNPKVVQATMGSLARVNVVYTDLNQLVDTLPPHYPVYGTLLEGQNIYGQELTDEGLIIMGNEGNGISPALRRRVNRQLLIPHYPEGRATAESLNVAIATAITCAEFRRRHHGNRTFKMRGPGRLQQGCILPLHTTKPSYEDRATGPRFCHYHLPARIHQLPAVLLSSSPRRATAILQSWPPCWPGRPLVVAFTWPTPRCEPAQRTERGTQHARLIER
jgi:tRNA(Leu) C34 or U34 (ribose-2'-O)-methylase TrmL